MTGSHSHTFFGSLMVALLSLCVLIGCKTDSPFPYVSPRLTGRVLDSRTHQPIAGVRVQRILSLQSINEDAAPHGGEMLQQPSPAWTGTNGMFVLEATRDLLGREGWYAVNISYSSSGYATLVTNYTLANAVLSSNGVPVVKAGDILLPPSPK